MNSFRVMILLLLLACIGCKQKNKNYQAVIHDPILFCRTVKELNNVVLQNNFPPMIASRNYAYANIAAYEVMVAGDNRFQSLTGQIKHFPAMPRYDTSNVDFQFASLLAFCKVGEAVTFPEGSMKGYVEQLNRMADSAGMPSSIMQASKVFADSVANYILNWSKKDKYLTTRSASKYTVSNEEGRWVPTPPGYDQALEAHWMEIRPLVLDTCSQFMPVRPPKYDIKDKNSVFYKALMEIKNMGDSLTDEQKHIADFWDDNPIKKVVIGHAMMTIKKFSPPGHWMNIVGIASEKAKADFSTTVYAYTKTAIALYDGFISCWDEKFRSNYIRPETVINKYVDPDWRPHIQTPPFPSYTSGHSTISAAAAEVMTEIFGNISFTDTSLLEFGIKNREIRSFRDAAKEAGISRLYGGIHYRFDNDNGALAGRKLGELIVHKLKMKKEPELTLINSKK